jgi:aspartate aminotransferase-like enzyme
MLPPGLAFISVSPKAWAVIDANKSSHSFYFNLKKYREALKTQDTPFTPANTLLKALRVSLKMIRKEGVENVWARHARIAKAARAGVVALNLKLFATHPVDGLTVFHVPEGVDGSALLSKLESRFNLKVAGGQDTLKGKIVRLAHMGYIDQFDVLAALAGLELVLRDLGHKLEIGAGVAAFQRSLAESN